jgi:hypothetical protein
LIKNAAISVEVVIRKGLFLIKEKSPVAPTKKPVCVLDPVNSTEMEPNLCSAPEERTRARGIEEETSLTHSLAIVLH